MISAQQLSEIRARAEKVIDGPWNAFEYRDHIAAVRTDNAALLSEIERLRGLLKESHAALFYRAGTTYKLLINRIEQALQ